MAKATKPPVVNNELETAIAERQATAPAPREEANMPAWYEAEDAMAVHNFPNDPTTVWEMSSNATDGETVPGADMAGQQLEIRHFYIHRIFLENDVTGEFEPAFRTVLITPDDNQYAFVSQGVYAAMQRMIAAFGIAPFDPPKLVKVRQISTAKKRKFLTLVPMRSVQSPRTR